MKMEENNPDLESVPSKTSVHDEVSSQKSVISDPVEPDNILSVKSSTSSSIKEDLDEDDHDSEEIAEDEDKNFDKEKTTRDKLHARLIELELENRIVEAQSTIIQRELVRYFRRNKIDRALTQGPSEPHSAELEKQYRTLLDNYRDELTYKNEVFSDCERKVREAEDEAKKAKENFLELFNGNIPNVKILRNTRLPTRLC